MTTEAFAAGADVLKSTVETDRGVVVGSGSGD